MDITTFLDLVTQAAQARKLIMISYISVEGEYSEGRIVESYSMRDGGMRFFAHDRTGDPPGIRGFLVSGIETVVVLDEVYEPRFPVEF